MFAGVCAGESQPVVFKRLVELLAGSSATFLSIGSMFACQVLRRRMDLLTGQKDQRKL